jgi:hypothetical protein
MFEQHVVLGLGWLAAVTLTMIISGIVALASPKGAESWGTIVFCVSGALTAISLIVAGFTLFPYQPKYWAWETKEGRIVTSEFDAKADTSSRNSWERGGLRMELNDGTSFFTQDFRLAEKRPGEMVKLVCKPTFQSGNVDRLDCKSQVGSM